MGRFRIREQQWSVAAAPEKEAKPFGSGGRIGSGALGGTGSGGRGGPGDGSVGCGGGSGSPGIGRIGTSGGTRGGPSACAKTGSTPRAHDRNGFCRWAVRLSIEFTSLLISREAGILLERRPVT
jgi:hypothetical protein